MPTLSVTTLANLPPTCGMLDCGKSTVTTGTLALVVLLLVILTRTCNVPLMSTSGVATPGSFGPLAEPAVLVALLKSRGDASH
jgi:hypothetical protein